MAIGSTRPPLSYHNMAYKWYIYIHNELHNGIDIMEKNENNVVNPITMSYII